KTWEGVGYGYGYAFAQDDICPMADDYVTVRAQRSRYFAPTATYAQRGNSTTPQNRNSDFFFQRAINNHIVEKLVAQPPTQAQLQAFGERLFDLGIGSNAVALGRAATRNGSGLMLGNPHFPWDGTERFYEAHATIPGKVNVIGGSLFGVPAVLIGHTDGLAWSHTVSTAFRFTPFELKLVPGDPTSYVYDGVPHKMKADKVTVQVKQQD